MIPRFGSESMGAERLGLPLATFRHWVRIGRLPGPVPDLDLYDLKALDAACDRMSGLGSADSALDAWRQGRERRNGSRTA